MGLVDGGEESDGELVVTSPAVTSPAVTSPAVTSPAVTSSAVTEAMRDVIDPELRADVVELGMYRGFSFDGGVLTVEVALTTALCPLRAQITTDVKERLGSFAGVERVEVKTVEMSLDHKRRLMDRARQKAAENPLGTQIRANTRIFAISSGKGGVGKSSVTVNLAAALASRGLTVGVLDADIAGFSIPRMLGVEGVLDARRSEENGKLLIQPVEKKVGTGTLKVVSMGFLSPEGESVMWRGLMLNRAVQHFLEEVDWGDLDYMLVDMPPGTGDIQMGLARMLPRAEMIIVTTPALAAQKVAARAADMARKGFLQVAGVVENMSGFTCTHGETYQMFGSGGGERLAAEIGSKVLARIPIEPGVSAGGDVGQPVSLGEGPAAQAFATLAKAVLDLKQATQMSACSVRILDVLRAEREARPQKAVATG